MTNIMRVIGLSAVLAGMVSAIAFGSQLIEATSGLTRSACGLGTLVVLSLLCLAGFVVWNRD